MDDDREVLSNDGLGRINLPGPTPEQLEAAAEDCLGDGVDEAPLPAGKVFKGGSGYFLQGSGESLGEPLASAAPELQNQLMDEAAKVRKFRAAVEAQAYTDPATNPMIKFPGED